MPFVNIGQNVYRVSDGTGTGGLPEGWIDVTAGPYLADGNADITKATANVIAFRTAIAALDAAGGGVLWVPPGTYYLTRATAATGHAGSKSYSIGLERTTNAITIAGVKNASWLKHVPGLPLASVAIISSSESKFTLEGIGLHGNWGQASTFVLEASNQVAFSAGMTINVDSTADFPSSGRFHYVTPAATYEITYASRTATTFVNCGGVHSFTLCYGDVIGHVDFSGRAAVHSTSNGAVLPGATSIALSGDHTATWPASGTAIVNFTPTVGSAPTTAVISYASLSYGGGITTLSTVATVSGSGTLATGNTFNLGNQAYGINQVSVVDPRNYGLMCRGGDVLVRDCVFKDIYGDAIWLGASVLTNDDYRKGGGSVRILDSNIYLTARSGIAFAGKARNLTVQNVSISHVFATPIDFEPFETGVYDVNITGCNELRGWFNPHHPSRGNNLAISVAGGRQVTPDPGNWIFGANISNCVIYGATLMQTTKNCSFVDNTIICDHAGYSTTPLMIRSFGDGITIHSNEFYDRTVPDPTAVGVNHDCVVEVQHYSGAVVSGMGTVTVDTQPAFVSVMFNRIEARNGRGGIKVKGTGGGSFNSGVTNYGTSGVATAITHTTLTHAGAGWTENQWTGYRVRVGTASAVIESNTTDTLTLFYEMNGMGGAYLNSWRWGGGQVAPTPAAAAYVISTHTGMVDVAHNQINCGNDGHGAGGNGIYLYASKSGMRARVAANEIRNATQYGIYVQSSDANRAFRSLEIVDNKAYDDQITPTCLSTVHFVSPFHATKLILRNNQAGDGVASAVTGLASGTWLINDGISPEWAGYSSPEGVVTAPVGSKFHCLNGGVGTAEYVKESGTGNVGWAAMGGVGSAAVPYWTQQLALVGATFDPTSLGSANATCTPGQVLLIKARIYSTTFDKIVLQVGTAIVGGTSVFVGVYKSDGTQTAAMTSATVDAIASLGTTGLKTITLSNAVTVTTADDVYVAILVTGAPGTNLALRSSTGNVVNNGNLTAAQGYRSGASGAGLAALPASITLASMTTSAAMAWIGVQ